MAASFAAIPGISGMMQQGPYLLRRLWQAIFGIIGSRKKRRPWGRVVDATSGNPLKGVIVNVIDAQRHKIRDTMVTNDQGEFASLLPSGSYQFHLQFPGWVLTPKARLLGLSGERVYDGRPVPVTKEKIVPIVIAMRMVEEKRSRIKMFFQVFGQQFAALLNRVSWPVLLFGFALNTVVVYTAPHLLNILFEIVYVLLIALKAYIAFRYKHTIGSVTDDATGKPVDLATVRLYEAETGRMVSSRVTSHEGHFVFLPKPGVYTLMVGKVGYETYRESHIVVHPRKEQLAFSIRLTPSSSNQSDEYLTPQTGVIEQPA